MHFRIPGSLQAGVDGAMLPLGRVIKRRLLAYLLLNANRVVATHKLLDVLWADEAPRTARKMIGYAVRDLRLDLVRGVVDTRAALLTRAPGYQLRVEPDAVDLFVFRRRVERGRTEAGAGDHVAAARTALYRCGRRTDALSVFRHIRSEPVERFGLEPSRELRRLERAILEHAPDLEVPAAGPVVERRRAPERARVPALVA
ncbi:BTAD domain-containing putative transcriptional regulator [Streptomyces sioyaensis]|uniref:AfsR/SARP family transcriptional regulator n=1 Tax=Streptomyces sioyaensis TaxID=67364 RepID=UPI00378D6FE7